MLGAALLISSEDGTRDRVGGRALALRRKPQQLALVQRNALRRDDILNDEVALCDGAGLIHDDGLYVIERLERRAALEQDAAPRACANAGEVGQRHAEHQRARARDNEESHGGVYPFMPLAGEQAGHNGGQQRDRDDRRGVDTGKTGDKAVDLRLARRGIFHAVKDALHHALRKHMRDADLHGAVGVDAAGSHPVADGHADRL